MEGAGKNPEKTNLSLQMNGHSRDLLHGVSNQTHLQNGNAHNNGGEADGDGLQLSLGLSMNGTFGVDPACKKLRRSSSISNLVFSAGGSVDEAARDSHAPLVRTSSLPVENEEEVRRRKEKQSVRPLVARKKRNWKKNARGVKDKEDSCDAASNESEFVGSVSVQKTEIGVVNGVENGKVFAPSQGSIGSQRSGSSGFSDIQSQHMVEGATQNAEVKSSSSLQSAQVQVEQEAPIRANAPDRNGRRNNGLVSTTLLDMPYVCTRGVENRIDGFLYKYEKGDDVKIVCVCHGLFHSPAEFVRHGGGGDVENPLRHIVVNTAPLF